ncbi:hypothetical protein FG379_003697 [Cryptosporidium bovis]|uniref:uncharacterized protein n=1 Tax=Cryptosporidium bovis TaxID=310047 RepID=UPI00351A80DA|nr:hypothetical protein FG379_003697 [Cryptosporidium bovis]
MFSCFRSCSDSPFCLLFGFKEEKTTKNYGSDRSHRALSSKVSVSSEKSNRRRKHHFEKRTPDEVLTACRAWENYIHPRAKDFWKSSEQVYEILSSIANNIERDDDPITNGDEQCVRWHGELSADDGSPVIRIMKPGETDECQTYVNRILVFLYADDESFLELQRKPLTVFKNACEDPLCINLNHISLDD